MLGGKPYTFEVEYSGTRYIYFYLIQLDRFYGIDQLHENYHREYSYGDDLKLGEAYLFDSKGKKVFGVAEGSNKAKNHFLLIASRDPLVAPYAIVQNGFDENLGKILTSDDWREIENKQHKGERSKTRSLEYESTESSEANWTVVRMEVIVEKI